VAKQVKNLFNYWQRQESYPIDFSTSGKLKVNRAVVDDQKEVKLGHSEILFTYAEYVRKIILSYQ